MSAASLNYRDLLTRQDVTTNRTGLIPLSDGAGTIVAVGTDKDVITVKVGQKVMYDQYAGTKVKVDSDEHLIVKMADVLAVIE